MQKLLPLLFPCALFAGEPLRFTVSPVSIEGANRLEVSVEFQGAAGGVSYLAYQDNQFGEPNQMAFVEFPPQDAGIQVSKEPDSNRFVIRHKPGQYLRVKYQVLDLQANSQQFYQYCCNKPIIRPEYFHLQTCHLLAAPVHYWDGPEDRQEVQLRWVNFPPDWVLHNSFGPDSSQQLNLSSNEFNAAIFVGGDFRRIKFEVKGQPVYLLTRGTWMQFSQDTLVNLLQKTVDGHRSFWNDFSDSIYSITFLPIDDAPWTENSKATSLGGSGLTNSFLSFATNNPGVSYDLIRYVWVHELMHHWIGLKIINADEERQYWFSEGFTEYFTLKNSLRYGLITSEGFLEDLNSFVSGLYSSPQRNMPNDSINYEHFWNGGKEWEKLPYRRGCVYAFYLDNLIRSRSGGKKNLDQFMRQVLATVRNNPGQKLDHRFFKRMLRAYAGRESAKYFQRYIEEGQLIPIQKTSMPEGLEVEVRDITMRSGPSRDIITKVEVLKNIPIIKSKAGADQHLLREALLK